MTEQGSFMRYPENIPKEKLAVHASDEMLLFTMVLAFAIGVILTWLGIKGKQTWMMVWSLGLIIISTVTFFLIWLDWM
jgi:membrane protein YdbS with pleckstrin-like domain